MKNLSLTLNIVLLVAVGVLYYLHFSKPDASSTENQDNPSDLADLKLAYIISDSVLKHYDYLKVNREQLESKAKKLEQEYRNRAQGLQTEISNYQQNAGNLTMAQARAVEEDLTKKQQNLRMYEQSLSQEIMNEEAKLNKDLYDRITDFLKKYGHEKGLQVVLKYDPNSDVLFGVETLDITQDVIAGLNESYKQETAKPETKADSTAAKK
jgi:outer membrane protein